MRPCFVPLAKPIHANVNARDTHNTHIQAPPSWETLKIVALQRAVPFMGFGFMDNGP